MYATGSCYACMVPDLLSEDAHDRVCTKTHRRAATVIQDTHL